jgi:hypothetical protein
MSMAGPVATFLAQAFWWALPIQRERLGFDRRGLYTAWRKRLHRQQPRLIHLGLVTGGVKHRNIIDLHAFWMNERFTRCRVTVDPEPGLADVLWVFSQDPISIERWKRIELSITAARRGTPVINAPAVYDFYHHKDAFEQLAAAGVPVPRTHFGPEERGRLVIWKPLGSQSETFGPVPYEGPIEGLRPFEFVNVQEQDGLHWRFRALFVLGAVYSGETMASHDPIVRYSSAVSHHYDSRLTEAEANHVRTIAKVSNLDFFAVDFLRIPSTSSPVFTDINVFPMLKEKGPAGWYGHRHDFDSSTAAPGEPADVWSHLEDSIVNAAARIRP